MGALGAGAWGSGGAGAMSGWGTGGSGSITGAGFSTDWGDFSSGMGASIALFFDTGGSSIGLLPLPLLLPPPLDPPPLSAESGSMVLSGGVSGGALGVVLEDLLDGDGLGEMLGLGLDEGVASPEGEGGVGGLAGAQAAKPKTSSGRSRA